GTTTAVPCAADCIPESTPVECTTADCIPSSAGGAVPIGSGNAVATLPFTGISDMLAPALLALVVVLAGVVAWRWAQLREAVAAAASRARDMPRYGASPTRTGYEGARRQLDIEQRARRVFEPRVA
ncbi:MAG: hypothetical protein JWM86_876, partial [Thermoleophilia bacterium]|nr:hypothetical protein [Thermoleophilia bacterium]